MQYQFKHRYYDEAHDSILIVSLISWVCLGYSLIKYPFLTAPLLGLRSVTVAFLVMQYCFINEIYQNKFDID